MSSRLTALALAATGGSVSASPLKALDNGLSIAPASRTEQVINFNKRSETSPFQPPSTTFTARF
ncbi:hypothetical protein MVLG_06580 [Microbotryum lychnidis-dioicae p1A1 Lamole]|uniref:Uncharacterized protein n=1 Tax=Microbotryum lychnidis-dioicae (strain p1A1 Lamole / MvSl-1064) TaxID=683840 RepID=U5HHQ4_USTV1|nr:hypothetical protein MVLG_06580 [Microbotryum lychnidis-dioicae p1A1 Lamole]|eukprot:KDE02895.1 hypothetical protein MVLG_06580 [Microbotryum lychnidis-dioicae p1A1 Lamole]